MRDKDLHCHHDHVWGPHGPDGAYVPRYVWPDVYHPVPYGREYEGNENLSMHGEHWCPPRDHGRHGCGCGPEPCHGGQHLPCNFTDVMEDYMDTAQRLLNATTYQERCDCVDELKRTKVKMEKVLKNVERQLDENDKAIERLNRKIAFYTGRFKEMADTFTALTQAVEDVKILDYQNYYTKDEVDNMNFASPYPLIINGQVYDGSAKVNVDIPVFSVGGKAVKFS